MAKLTLEQFKRKVERWGGPTGRAMLLDGMTMVAQEMLAYARRTHLHGPRMPLNTTGGFAGSTLASKTGLRHRLTTKSQIIGGEVKVQLGTNLTSGGHSYPRYHEYGSPGGMIPERPWLRPSVAAKQKRLLKVIGEVWVAAWKIV